jgi:hypothetical protein
MAGTSSTGAAPVRDVGILQARSELNDAIEIRRRRHKPHRHVAPRYRQGQRCGYWGLTPYYEYSYPSYFPSAAYYPFPVCKPGGYFGYGHRYW